MQILRELKKQFVIPSFAVLVGRSSCLCSLLLLSVPCSCGQTSPDLFGATSVTHLAVFFPTPP